MNTQIVKLLKRLLAFVVVGFFIYAILICVWGTYLPRRYVENLNFSLGSSYIRFQEVKEYKNIDILFAGSSHAFRGFDPRIFENAGYSTFNIGSSGQTPLQTKYLLEQYIDELHPKILITEVYPLLLTNDGVESSLDIISNNKDVNGLKLVWLHKNFRVLNTFIYSSFYNSYRSRSYNREIELLPTDTYIGKGYVERKMLYNKVKDYKQEELIYLELQFDFLDKVDEICKNRGVLPIYVMAPIDNKLYGSFVNIDLFEERMENLGIFYDFNKLMKLNDTLHFYDSHHLNQNGVELFNRELIKILNSLDR